MAQHDVSGRLPDILALIDSSLLTTNEKHLYSSICRYISDTPRTTVVSHESTLPLLASIALPQESHIPIACLSFLLDTESGPWPTLDLIQSYTKYWRALPEEAKSGQGLTYSNLVETTLRQVKGSYRSLTDLLVTNEKAAIVDEQSQNYLSHQALSKFIHNFDLPIWTVRGDKKPVVVLALPNGNLLGLACMAVAAYYIAAPINSQSGAEQFRTDVEQTESNVVLVLRSDFARLGLGDSWVSDSGIQVLLLEPEPDMTFTVSPLSPMKSLVRYRKTANGPDDISFILFTSGTGGMKKVVPLPLHNVVSGVAFVIDSWGLTVDDICLNMMPLNHVGGLVRNLFAPILSGGSTICCSAFDPSSFWDIVEEHNPTWYYASPSMHSTILSEAANRVDAVAKNSIRLVCNAAGGLLPSLAVQLQNTFKCTVLPSYGMTECMPISTPPLDYHLDRPGTLGVSAGPEIAILDGNDKRLSPREIGRIAVRGASLFPGYLKSDYIDSSVFTRDGWFDTGDMGFLDKDGYLYVTGRSKEVVNRGGELISPFEVEEAIMVAAANFDSPVYQRISEALAFSVPHDVLQEVVGVALVTPSGKPRPDIRQLNEAVKSSLRQTKWPVVIVYMDSLPRKNNKILRVRLGERLSFDTLSDDTKLAERHFEATCPPKEAPLSEKIRKKPCKIDCVALASAVGAISGPQYESHIIEAEYDGLPELIVAPIDVQLSSLSAQSALDNALTRLHQELDGYLVPTSITHLDVPFPLDSQGVLDKVQLNTLLQLQIPGSVESTSTERKICDLFSQLLRCPVAVLTPQSDFFDIGGDSLKAGRLLSMLRIEFQVRLPIGDLFRNSEIRKLASIVDERYSTHEVMKDNPPRVFPLPGCTKTYSSTNPLILCIQLLPIVLLYPIKRAFQWTLFLYFLTYSILIFPVKTTLIERFLYLVISLTLAKFGSQICSPIVGIAIKWLVIGRYRAGMYPMWGPYHTRWWLVEKALLIAGKGIFGYSEYTKLLYYRLLGAKIGRNVSISGTVLGEYDLLEIGDNVQLDGCICRPFAVEHNTSMYLDRISLGRDSTVGLKAFIAPGTILPNNTCIGPNSSSWEIQDATEANRDLMSQQIPKAHPLLFLLFGVPVKLLIRFVSALPWMAGLVGIVVDEPLRSSDMLKSVIIWFSQPHRVAFHYFARILSVTVSPFVFFALVILLKKSMNKLWGKIKAGPALYRSQTQKFRMSLLPSLLPRGDLSKLTDLFGSHYEMTSTIVRALGGKVGKRVYWPGGGPTIQDFDLLEVGDGVVFGSRSHIRTSDGVGSHPVRIEDGAMVADRVILLPGTTLGKNAVLGSGALTKRDTVYPADTVWIGAKEGGAICLTAHKQPNGSSTSLILDDDTLVDSQRSSFEREQDPMRKEVDSPSNPFGRAFYEGKATYHVFGQLTIFFYSTLTNIFVSIYWNVAPISAVQVLAKATTSHLHSFGPTRYRPFLIFTLFVAVTSAVILFQSVLALALIITAKWSLLGRRRPGTYHWDTSSYCQRWQIFLTIERLRRHCFSNHGIIGLLTGTHFAVLYFRALGARIGKDCALWAGGRASLLFTEPDLLTLGDRVAVDDASLVAHVNSRGNFSLSELSVGDRSVLRSGSRLLAGARMGMDACLLEHTLVVAGDGVDDGGTWQGWPADVFEGERVRVRGGGLQGIGEEEKFYMS